MKTEKIKTCAYCGAEVSRETGYVIDRIFRPLRYVCFLCIEGKYIKMNNNKKIKTIRRITLVAGILEILIIIGIIFAAGLDQTGKYGVPLAIAMVIGLVLFIFLNEWHERLMKKKEKL